MACRVPGLKETEAGWVARWFVDRGLHHPRDGTRVFLYRPSNLTAEGTMKSRYVGYGLVLGLAWVVLLSAGTQDAAAQNALNKAVRGAAGMTCGFMELPGNIYDTGAREGAAKGWTLGFVKGIVMIPVRTLVGVYEFVSAPIPVPENFAPVLDPPTPFGYWNSSLREQNLSANPSPSPAVAQSSAGMARPSTVPAKPATP